MHKTIKGCAPVFIAIMLSLAAGCGEGGNKVSQDTETTINAENQLTISLNQEYMYAPHTGETAVSKQLTVENTTDSITWKILSTTKGVSINDGVITITDEYVAGDINGTDIVISATTGTGYGETTLHVREPQRVGSFELDMPDFTTKGSRMDCHFVNVKDQYGEDYTFDSAVAEWQYSASGIEFDGSQISADIDTREKTYAAVICTVDNVSVEKRFIISGDWKYKPTEEDLKALSEASIKMLSDVDFTVPRVVDKNSYSLILDVTGKSEIKVNVSNLKSFAEKQLYMVTVLHNDGTTTSMDLEAVNGEITVALQNAVKIEVSPVIRLALGSATQAKDTSYKSVSLMERYTGVEDYGFYGKVNEFVGGVTLKNEDSYFVTALPDGFYNIKITKPEEGRGRSTVRINGASLGTNVGNPGTGDRAGAVPYIYLMEDVNVLGGNARISLSEKDFTLAAVEIRKTPEIVNRRVHVYIGGDSTVSNYYPIETEIPANGRYQTGWGQVFAQYTKDTIAVTNMAGGGTYAKSWYEMAFPGVIQNGQPGDYFILHAGINDKTYSSIDEMCVYITKMIEECEAKGITVILTTAMQSPKFWRTSDGKDLPEFGTPEGGGLAAFMDAIRKLAVEKNVFLVDVGKLTGEWYGQLGRTYVAQNYHLYNTRTSKEEDTLHLSYAGAMKVAEFVATDLVRQQKENATNHLGQTLNGLEFNELITYTVTHTDANGKTVDTPVTAVKSIYKRYAE